MNVYFKYSKRLLQMFVATRYATQIRSSSNVCRYSICDLEKVEFKCFEVPFERSEPLFGDRRRNGKSELAAAIALYLLYADNEPSAEVYGAAADRQQASIVFDVARQMVEMSPAHRRILTGSDLMKCGDRMIQKGYNGFIKSEFNAWEKIMEFLDSEMMKRFMHSAPVNIFFKDTECRYCFASEICDLVSVGENGSIVGKTDLEIQKFPEMGKMYYEDDKKILATGEDSQYISEFSMEDGESLYFEIKKSAVRDENGNIIGIIGIVDNVTERVRLEKKVEELSIIDGLTGVYNRNYLKYRVEEKKKKMIFPFTVIMSDCNYLKEVNDQFGHEYGDILLKIVAGTLKEEMPEDSPVIRMGGDEFMILGNGITEEKAFELMANIRGSLKRKSKDKIPLSLAMGSYTIQSKDFSFDEVCHEADLRMYADKKRLKADESVEITE